MAIVDGILQKRDWLMNLETGFAAATDKVVAAVERRADDDRRTYSDRRRPGGLFEVRARRDGTGYDRRQGDRRQGDRREQIRSWLSRWRRED